MLSSLIILLLIIILLLKLHLHNGKGHFYWFVPVFANSSYSISWPSGTQLNFGFIDSLSRYVPNSNNDFYYNSYNFIDSNDQGSYGYFATKDGYLVIDQWKYNFPDKTTLSITTDYDYSSNLATIHTDNQQLIKLLTDYLYGTNETIQSIKKVNGLNAGQSGKFSNNASYTTLYFTVKQAQHYTINFNTSSSPTEAYFKFGYTDNIPGDNVSYIDRNLWSSINYSTSYEFTASRNSYFYLTYVTTAFSGFSIYGTVNEDIQDGINGQIINQGEETRQTITDSSISQSATDYSLPSDSTSDITQDGFSNIFDRIRTTFTTGASTPATINIPFTNKSFTISQSSVFGSANLGIVKTIIQSFWWFIVSLFIVKDIFKKIEKLKTGNIEFTETTNIKEDIL